MFSHFAPGQGNHLKCTFALSHYSHQILQEATNFSTLPSFPYENQKLKLKLSQKWQPSKHTAPFWQHLSI